MSLRPNRRLIPRPLGSPVPGALGRSTALVAVLAALVVAGCGGGGSSAGGAGGGGRHVRAGYATACAFHVWRAEHNFRNHHKLLAAFHAYRVAHNCPRSVR